jgi:hypothetical protein
VTWHKNLCSGSNAGHAVCGREFIRKDLGNLAVSIDVEKDQASRDIALHFDAIIASQHQRGTTLDRDAHLAFSIGNVDVQIAKRAAKKAACQDGRGTFIPGRL